jgi:hypothetical protein
MGALGLREFRLDHCQVQLGHGDLVFQGSFCLGQQCLCRVERYLSLGDLILQEFGLQLGQQIALLDLVPLPDIDFLHKASAFEIQRDILNGGDAAVEFKGLNHFTPLDDKGGTGRAKRRGRRCDYTNSVVRTAARKQHGYTEKKKRFATQISHIPLLPL